MKWKQAIDEVIQDLEEDRWYRVGQLVDWVLSIQGSCVRKKDMASTRKSIRTLLARDRRIEKVHHGTYRKREV